MTLPDWQPVTIAAWLHIGPRDSHACTRDAYPNECDACENAVGLQRLHVARDVPRVVAFSHLAAVIHAVLARIGAERFNAQLGGSVEWHRQVAELAAILARKRNVVIDIGGGMVATIYPAEPTSGVNLDHDIPEES